MKRKPNTARRIAAEEAGRRKGGVAVTVEHLGETMTFACDACMVVMSGSEHDALVTGCVSMRDLAKMAIVASDAAADSAVKAGMEGEYAKACLLEMADIAGVGGAR